MIIRILGEGQWVVPDEALARLNTLDDAVEQAVGDSDEGQLAAALQELLEEVRAAGTRVPDEELQDSDLILPDVGSSLADVRAMLSESDEGLIPN